MPLPLQTITEESLETSHIVIVTRPNMKVADNKIIYLYFLNSDLYRSIAKIYCL